MAAGAVRPPILVLMRLPMLILLGTLLGAVLQGCTLETEGPAAPESPSGQAASAIERAGVEAAAIETLLAEVEALAVTAREDGEGREAALAASEQKLAEIEERRVKLDAALAEAALLLEAE